MFISNKTIALLASLGDDNCKVLALCTDYPWGFVYNQKKGRIHFAPIYQVDFYNEKALVRKRKAEENYI